MQKLIHRGIKDIHIWWVDDCFTTAAPEVTGGSFQLSVLGKWNDEMCSFQDGVADVTLNDDSSAMGDNGLVYFHLKQVATVLNVSLHLCSFEFADKNWRELDKENTAILLDIGYHGRSDTHGIELWLSKHILKPLTAKLRFFTGQPERVAQFCVAKGVEPETPPCMAKTEAIVAGGLGSISRIQRLVEALIASQPTDLGELNAEQWQSLRDAVWISACSYATSEGVGSDGGWVHHLPGGGDRKTNYSHKATGMNALRQACLHPVTKVPLKIPDHFWTCSPRWKYPPLRAIAQQTLEAMDLSRFFHHLWIEASGRAMGRVHIDICYPAGAFKHDYLWLNVVALGEGLIRLSDGFTGEMIKAGKQGRTMWTIRELLENGFCGLEILIRQFVELDFPETEEADAGKLSRGRNGHSPCGVFVDKAIAKKSIMEAHRYFENAGAVVTGIHDGKDWKIVVMANEIAEVWRIRSGGSR